MLSPSPPPPSSPLGVHHPSYGVLSPSPPLPPQVSTTPSDGVLSALSSLKEAAGRGNAKGSKVGYVEVVAALEGWADAVGVSGSLKGL